MSKQSKDHPTLKPKKPTPHVGLDGSINQIQLYTQRLKNQQLLPSIIESLTNDLQFNMQWMLDLDQNWKKQQGRTSQFDSLIGYTHIITGPPLCGKFGYVFMRKERDLDVKIVKIDCMYYFTVNAFICELIDQLAGYLEKSVQQSSLSSSALKNKKKSSSQVMQDAAEQLSKRIIIQDSVNLKELDHHIRSKPNLKFLIVVKNAEKLVQQRKQTILYNLFQWIKTDIRTQIGLVLITRAIDFTGDKMEKRVRSRLTSKSITLFGVSSEKVVKQALIKRFTYSLKTINQSLKSSMTKFIKIFEKSTQVDKIIKQQYNRSPKQLPFFLQLFKLIFCLGFKEKSVKGIKQLIQFQESLQIGYQKALEHISPYSQRQKVIFREMSFPQFIVMGIIRKMLLDQKPKITFKQIKLQLGSFRSNTYTKYGNSFQFNQRVYERAVENLRRLKIIDLYGDRDFQNAEILSNLLPKDIKDAVLGRDDIPQSVKRLYDF